MSSVRELKQSLIAALRDRIEAHGFKLVKSRDWFVRKRSGVKDYLVIGTTDVGHLRVEPYLRIRIDRIEEIFHHTSDIKPEYQPDFPTLGVHLKDFSDDGAFHHVRTDEEVPSVAAAIGTEFERDALPFFERLGSVEGVDSFLNEGITPESIKSGMDFYRCSHGLIAAKLANRPSYAELRETYREHMRKMAGGSNLPKFEALIADLDNAGSGA